MRNGHEERLTNVLSPKIEFTDDPTLVARIVDPGDLAPRRQTKVRRLLLHLGQQGGRRRCRERQGRFELGDEQLNLEGIVDHEQPFRPAGSARADACVLRGRRDAGQCGFPVPWQQVGEHSCGMTVDPGQDIRQPDERVDLVEVRCRDQGRDSGRPVGAPLRAGKQP